VGRAAPALSLCWLLPIIGLLSACYGFFERGRRHRLRVVELFLNIFLFGGIIYFYCKAI
jgi:hypothetical protein